MEISQYFRFGIANGFSMAPYPQVTDFQPHHMFQGRSPYDFPYPRMPTNGHGFQQSMSPATTAVGGNKWLLILISNSFAQKPINMISIDLEVLKREREV